MSELQEKQREKARDILSEIEPYIVESAEVFMNYYRGIGIAQGGLLRCPED